MRISTIGILVGIIACSGLLLFEPGGLMRGSQARSVPGLLFSDLSRADSIQFDGPAKCGFERDGNQWVFMSPAGAPVRLGAVERLLDRIGTLRASAVLSKADRDARNMTLPELGLDPAEGRIRVKTGETVQTLLIGSRTAFKNSVYAHELGSDEVMTVPAAILSAFPADPFELRDTSIGIPAADTIVRIEMDRPDGFFQATRPNGGVWGLSQPFTSRLDPTRVQSMFNSLSSARMEQIVTDEPGDLGQYGLVENVHEFRWWTQGDVNPQRLRIGKPVTDAAGFVYAQLGRFPTVFTLSVGTKAILELPVSDLRDKHLLPLDAAEITGVRILDEDSQPVTLGRAENGWEVLEPIQSKADTARVEALVRDWAAATAIDFPAGTLAEILAAANGTSANTKTNPLQVVDTNAVAPRIGFHNPAKPDDNDDNPNDDNARNDARNNATNTIAKATDPGTTGIEPADLPAPLAPGAAPVQDGLKPTYRLVFQRDPGDLPPAEAVRQIDVYHSGKRSFAHLKEEDVVAEVDNHLVATLSLDSLRYSDRRITLLDPAKVSGVERVDENGTQTFTRGPEQWDVAKDACILNENLFEKMLAAICNLEAVRLVTRDPPRPAQYGLDKPQLTITVSMREGALLRQTLLLGGPLPAGDGNYAMIRGQDVVFTLDGDTTEQLLSPFCLELP